jgi:hypothetical protein
VLIVLGVLAGLAACGTQFVYNRLDWLLHYYLSTQVSLDTSQSKQLRSNLKELVSWHRRNELPRYADFLERLAAASDKPLSSEQLEAGRAEIGKHVEHLIVKASPEVTRWLLVLREPQLDEFFASFAEDDAKERKKACDSDPDERREDFITGFTNGVEDWTGRLRRSQRAIVAERLAQHVDQSCAAIEMNARTWAAFRKLVDENRGDADFSAQVANFFLHPEQRWDADYRRDFDANNQRYYALLADLDQTLSREQRAHAVERLRDYARELRKLAREGGSSVQPLRSR